MAGRNGAVLLTYLCSPEAWQATTASECRAAIYRELQATEARSINDESYIPTRSLRRRGRRHTASV